ncbi:hypothetical protein BS47DRAFT_33037 [Hydnum rufescens UP504]|uniref:Replication factor A protein 3 n=1 Tax=Hydnum rufescens UP504 TaxID=1448309 RepID=A0A9P6B8K3_9AGAM|nr:hypothetical protein BS47DRAFT_33037 [Hydnum rufescens UP504]
MNVNQEGIAPRINSARLDAYVGRTIRLPCKVIKMQGDKVIVESGDGGQVEAKTLQDCQITDDYIEIIGTVLNADSVRMLQLTNLGNNIDLRMIDGLIELTFLHPHIFH